MAKEIFYVCTVCNFVFDQAVQGVNFEDLPDDYACPECGVSKESFDKVESYE